MEAGTPPAAAPSVDAVDSFIPPVPVERLFGSREARTADPFAAAAMANGGPRTGPKTDHDTPAAGAKVKGLSLFERVTGTGRAAKPSEPPPPASQESDSQGGLEGTEPAAAPTPEEELLDIPAFLRRQAN